MTWIVSLSYESDASTPDDAAADFAEVLAAGDIDQLLFQVVDGATEELFFVQPDTGRVMDALELLSDVESWMDYGSGSPLG